MTDPDPKEGAINSSTLVDFALGKLSPEESLRVLKEVETNKKLSDDLDFIIQLMVYFRDEFGGDAPKPE